MILTLINGHFGMLFRKLRQDTYMPAELNAAQKHLSGDIDIHTSNHVQAVVPEPLVLRFAGTKFSLGLVYITAALIVCSLGATIFRKMFLWVDFFTNALNYFFDVSLEGNIPTFFSAFLLLTASAICLFIYKGRTRVEGAAYYSRCWFILSMGFAFLSVDEACRIHEQFSKLTKLTGEHSGYMHHSWILPYGIIAAICGFFFLKFVKSLPRCTRNLFILSGVLYVGSAIGFEPLEGHLSAIYHADNIYDKLLCNLEEMCEMGSVILFINTLLSYASRQRLQVTF
jgi:hypothetical protein